MTLRQWLISSGLFGVVMFFLQFIAVLANILYDKIILLKLVSIINLLFFVFKLAYNVMAFVLLIN
jgi:hypothetical protein